MTKETDPHGPIEQLLIFILGFGVLFELSSSRFQIAQFWAVRIILFGLAFALSEFVAYLNHKVSYRAASRG